MIFNYSASIKTIRRNFVNEIYESIVNDIVNKPFEKLTDKQKNLLSTTIYPNVDPESAYNLMRKTYKDNFTFEVSNANVNKVYKAITDMVDLTYGAKLEDFLLDEFGLYDELNNLTNTMFKLQMLVFKTVYDTFVSHVDFNKLDNSTKKRLMDRIFALVPQTATANTKGKKDKVMIYDIIKSSTNTNVRRSYGVKTKLNSIPVKDVNGKTTTHKSSTAHPDTLDFTYVHAMGSVTPTHYLDAARVAAVVKALKEGNMAAVLQIFDAFVVNMAESEDTIYQANESFYNLHKNFSQAQAYLESTYSLVRSIEHLAGVKTVDDETMEIFKKEISPEKRNEIDTALRDVTTFPKSNDISKSIDKQVKDKLGKIFSNNFLSNIKLAEIVKPDIEEGETALAAMNRHLKKYSKDYLVGAKVAKDELFKMYEEEGFVIGQNVYNENSVYDLAEVKDKVDILAKQEEDRKAQDKLKAAIPKRKRKANIEIVRKGKDSVGRKKVREMIEKIKKENENCKG
jgi:hypothetical protein